MASDLEEEMQIESETRELLPRDGPITLNRYGSLVAFVAEDDRWVTWNSEKCWRSRRTC